jgi:hypothetical protein
MRAMPLDDGQWVQPLSAVCGRALPIVTHLIDSGKLTHDEVREAQKALRDLARKDNSQ